MEYQFYKEIFTLVDAAVAGYVSDTVADVTAAVSPVANSCLLLYVMLWGIAMYRGLIQEFLMDGIFRIMKIMLIITFATSVGHYSGVIADNLVALPDYLSQLVAGGNESDPAKSVLDTILSDTLDTGNKFWEQGSLSPLDFDIGPMILAVITYVMGFLCTAYAAFLLILSKLALGVLVGLGPIFILCMMFDGTKKFFESWLGQCLNFALVSALAIGIIKMLFGILASQAMHAAATPEASELGIQGIAGFVIIAGVSMLVLMQVMGMASALGGGIGLSTLGAAGAAWRASGAGKMASAAGGAAGRGARSAGSLAGTAAYNKSSTVRAGVDGARRVANAVPAWAHRKSGQGNAVSKAS